MLGGKSALKEAASKLRPYFKHLHAVHTPEMSILYVRAPLGSDTEAKYTRTALWRVTAAATALKPLPAMCDEILSEQLEQWAVNDELHAVLKAEYGFGWFSADELASM